jgi:hypothetical protein
VARTLVRSTCRVLPKGWRWSCVTDQKLIRRVVMFDWPPALLLKMSSPFPRAFLKMLYKNSPLIRI